MNIEYGTKETYIIIRNYFALNSKYITVVIFIIEGTKQLFIFYNYCNCMLWHFCLDPLLIIILNLQYRFNVPTYTNFSILTNNIGILSMTYRHSLFVFIHQLFIVDFFLFIHNMLKIHLLNILFIPKIINKVKTILPH